MISKYFDIRRKRAIRSILLLTAITFGLFFLLKMLIVVLYKLLLKRIGVLSTHKSKFNYSSSFSMIILFLAIWFLGIEFAVMKLQLNELEMYVYLCIMGMACAFWCYFSWDSERIFVKPHFCLNKGEIRIKKITIYSLILLFVLAQGYQQVRHSINSTYVVNDVFSVVNYSIIVAIIAMDRVLNQVVEILIAKKESNNQK